MKPTPQGKSEVRERALAEVRRIVTATLGGRRAHVLLVGSSARGTATSHSDIDVAIEAVDPISEDLISAIRNALDESDIPYRVDIFDLGHVDAQYRASLLEGAVPWTT